MASKKRSDATRRALANAAVNIRSDFPAWAAAGEAHEREIAAEAIERAARWLRAMHRPMCAEGLRALAAATRKGATKR